MATYEAWNKALFDYTIVGVPKGSRVYLAIDDEAVAWIAHDLETSANDFSDVLRLRCVSDGAIQLYKIYADGPKDYSSTPRYFAFLCAMVQAAHKMGENEASSLNDYFTYFNQILQLGISGRPPGLEHGAEEMLWKDWAFWLRYNGYQPTAIKTGEHYYTYARSQAMLRGVDKGHLWQHFGNNSSRFSDTWGKGELTTRLRADAKITTSRFSKHLRELLQAEGRIGAPRYDDLADALYETFESWIENGKPRELTKTQQSAAPSTIRAGLYRTEDYLSGDVSYYLLPRQPRHIQTTNASVVYHDAVYPLLRSRAGWFEPLPFQLSLAELENTLTLPVQGIDRVQTVAVNASDFWILPPDPDDEASGLYGSWTDHPQLGRPFVLLCKSNLKTDMEMLRNEKLISWTSEAENSGWLEYSGVVVVGEVWSDVTVEHKELVNQLRPRTYTGLALRGGLRDKTSGAWLIGCGPEVVVYAFAGQVSLNCLDLNDDSEVFASDLLKSGSVAPIEWTQRGDYILRVEAEGQQYERFVRIIDWAEIQLTSLETSPGLKLGNSTIFGAYIETGM